MILVTGAGGLIGSAVSKFFLDKKLSVIGIENNKRKFFFGKNGDIKNNITELIKNKKFKLLNSDINNIKKISKIYQSENIQLTIHAAAQPSHDWSATNPLIDYDVNAMGTLNLIEVIRKFKPNSQFVLSVCMATTIFSKFVITLKSPLLTYKYNVQHLRQLQMYYFHFHF